jgi:hypothetical protein
MPLKMSFELFKTRMAPVVPATGVFFASTPTKKTCDSKNIFLLQQIKKAVQQFKKSCTAFFKRNLKAKIQ